MLFNGSCLFVNKMYQYLKWSRIICVSFLTLLDGILHLVPVELEVYKLKTQLIAVIIDGRYIVKYLSQAVRYEPIVGVLLNFYQIGNIQHFFLALETHSHGFPGFNRMDPVFLH